MCVPVTTVASMANIGPTRPSKSSMLKIFSNIIVELYIYSSWTANQSPMSSGGPTRTRLHQWHSLLSGINQWPTNIQLMSFRPQVLCVAVWSIDAPSINSSEAAWKLPENIYGLYIYIYIRSILVLSYTWTKTKFSF